MSHEIQHTVETIPLMGLYGNTYHVETMCQAQNTMTQTGYTIVYQQLYDNTQTIFMSIGTAFTCIKTVALTAGFWVFLTVMAHIARFA